MRRFWTWWGILILGVLAAGCAPGISQAQGITATPPADRLAAALPSATVQAAMPSTENKQDPTRSPLDEETAAAAPTQPQTLPAASPTPAGTSTPDTRPLPRNWAEWPLIPSVSARAKEIYRQGLAMGNDPRHFSTIGDCQSEPPVFLGTYDSQGYVLGAGNERLEETIQNFKGSFNRDSITVKDGLSVASVLSPMWADPAVCQPDETPLDCELRIHRPSIMFINLGTNWKGGNDVTHEKYMRKIVDILLAHGVLPILGTKGDNQEGNQRINQSIARVAYDYDLPLWNFWRSIRDLPGKGLDGGRGGNYLSVEAWGRRSFTGLEALDAVWKEVR